MPDRRHISRLDRRLLHHKQDHRWHHEGDIDFFLLDQRQDQRRIDILENDILRAMGIADHTDIDPRHMEKRHADQIDLSHLPVGPARFLAALQNADIIGIGQLHTLGVACRAACIELDHIIVRRGGQHRVFGLCRIAPIIKRGPCCMTTIQRDHALDAGAIGQHLPDNVIKFRTDKKHFRARIVQHIGDFGWRKTPVDAHHHRFRLERAIEHFKIAVGPLADKADPRIRLHPVADQRLRHLACPLVQLAISRRAPFKHLRHSAAMGLVLKTRDIGDRFNVLAIKHAAPPGMHMDCRCSGRYHLFRMAFIDRSVATIWWGARPPRRIP